MTLIYLGLSWLAGIALAEWLQLPLPSLWLLALPAVAALLLWRREPVPRLITVCALVLLAGAVRTVWATPRFGPNHLPPTTTGDGSRSPEGYEQGAIRQSPRGRQVEVGLNIANKDAFYE